MADRKEHASERDSKKQKKEVTENGEELGVPVEAEFLFNDPEEDDYNGILAIIQGHLKKVPWEPPKGCEDSTYGLLAQLISTQPNLGTIIKTEKGEDGEEGLIMAVLSILNIQMYKMLESIMQPILELAELHGSQKDLETLKKILSDEKNQIGLVVNERLGNIPIQLIGTLHQCVYDDVKWSVENADDDEEREFYKFTHLIGFGRAYTDKIKTFDSPSMSYLKPEEKFYCEEAIVKFMWSTGESGKVDFFDVDGKPSKSKVLPEAMMLYCVRFERVKQVVQRISSTFL
ncbi:brca2 and cdkn1a interacting like protein [Babesia gibsoni]|uniref:Brca2 and cdkn1a interacting like protein n=1 Tax=Babesia gibsoni TaxID=33632 RepID=A0AAD8PCH5_BABGI|nr:brca2 and cdkn1a interacting like protein [Babesia gibsoni]